MVVSSLLYHPQQHRCSLSRAVATKVALAAPQTEKFIPAVIQNNKNWQNITDFI
jgi:hypothetical protein